MATLLRESDFCCPSGGDRINRVLLQFKIVNVSWLFFRIFVPHGRKNEFELTHITKFWYILGVI